MEAADIKKIKDLEDENRRLKQMFADLGFRAHFPERSHLTTKKH
ncbi:TPA: hypothetical protein U5E31_001981 [Yersinia enterocolitica]|nr:hypothetical protein [Yersinia enterocolitica]HDM8436877.1 hypothetical protein [Yersinia enterocolitica]HEN3566094.1 hypothetical protein [Yersinia enterocolitica]HEN3571110.1 hypothetical protein [Yersinia enterocolitica]HEN3575092.1 hypothetical protein [Yersinia enterocolitica]